MAARRRGGCAAGPTDWLLVFLHGRDRRRDGPRARAAGAGDAGGSAGWLSAFLAAAAIPVSAAVAAGAARPAGRDGGDGGDGDLCDPRAGRGPAYAGDAFAGFEGDTT
ncbi:MAG TPA: hypothetical protein VF069_11550 [Streptosporangiaceae bacterium]